MIEGRNPIDLAYSRVVRWKKDGMTYREMERFTGVSTSTLWRVYRQYPFYRCSWDTAVKIMAVDPTTPPRQLKLF